MKFLIALKRDLEVGMSVCVTFSISTSYCLEILQIKERENTRINVIVFISLRAGL